MTSPAPVRWRAPGRVNLIGDYTDLAGGHALPFALVAGCTATVRCVEGGMLLVSSNQLGQPVRIRSAELAPERVEGWAAYPLGVLWALAARGATLPGLDIELDSDVPVGAGLSSSAALTCAVASAVNQLLDLRLSRDELVHATVRAENEFAGAPTGGMDQMAALFGAPDQAVLCDMRQLQARHVPLDTRGTGLSLVVADTRVAHSNKDSAYRDRRHDIERATQVLGVAHLADLGSDRLAEALQLVPARLRACVRHVVTEDRRVLQVVDLLRANRLADIGPLLAASHESLRDDLRVSCLELDVAVAAMHEAGALGARMTGGGFGGSAVALVPEDRVGSVREALGAAFRARRWTAPDVFVVEPGPGARAIGAS